MNASPPPELRDEFDRVIQSMVDSHLPLREAVQAFRLAYLRIGLAKEQGNQVRAARILHLHRNSLLRYLRHDPELAKWLRELKLSKHSVQKQLRFRAPRSKGKPGNQGNAAWQALGRSA